MTERSMPSLKESFRRTFPETSLLLERNGLTIHPAVSRVCLHGSRGPKGGSRPDSDIDLSLLVDGGALQSLESRERILRDSLEATLAEWKGDVELDLAAVFDTRNCGLTCFNNREYAPHQCRLKSPDCFGLYKIQRGFNGYVEGMGVRIKDMYPCCLIWERE